LCDRYSGFRKSAKSIFSHLPDHKTSAALATKLQSRLTPKPLDPMDRIIGATALDRGVPLVTKDKMIRKAKALSVIW
jgi:PIN domain nuclease of toxin-antitoxin system